MQTDQLASFRYFKRDFNFYLRLSNKSRNLIT
jgi:hypothetical protein